MSFQIHGWTQLRDRLNMYMEQYNESIRGAPMDLVYFQDAMISLVQVAALGSCCIVYSLCNYFHWFLHYAWSSQTFFWLFTILDISNYSDVTRKCVVSGCWWVRQAELNETCFFHRWLQNISDHSDAVSFFFTHVCQ